MKLGYLLTEYPKVSHSFVRREIRGLEALGWQVERFSVRPCPDRLVDPGDLDELGRTRVLLADRSLLLPAAWRAAARRPRQMASAIRLALRVGWGSDRGLPRHAAYLAEAALLAEWLEAAGVQHLHAHFATNAAAVAMLCCTLGGPTYSFTAHGPYEFERASRLALGEKTARAAFAVAISAFGQRQLRDWCAPEQRERVHLIYNGLDAPLSDDLPPVSEARRFVCVGRLSPEKGFAHLLEAARLLAEEGEEFDLTIVGDGPLRQSLQDLAAPLSPRVRFEITGWASEAEVRRQMSEARALVLSSLAEGLPAVLTEAMALGRPVIATRVAGVPELVEDGVSGWLVPPASPPELASALRQALTTSPERLAEMGRCGRRRIMAQHDGSTQVRKLASLFRGAIVAAEARGSAAPVRRGA